MTRLDFNMAISRNVMGWETALDESSYSDTGYTYTEAGDVILGRDFTRDHNAAAMVRERISELGDRTQKFWLHHLLALVDARGSWNATWLDAWKIVSANPEQTARAAYLAITGEELEAIDG